jgi:hypothetical protein
MAANITVMTLGRLIFRRGSGIELQCTGSIPPPFLGHAAVLVDDVMYVFSGYSSSKGYLSVLYALQLSSE